MWRSSRSNARAIAEELASGRVTHIPAESAGSPTPRAMFGCLKHIEAIRSEPVVVVSNTFPDAGIVETLLLLIDRCRRSVEICEISAHRPWMTSELA